jgi:hypothetical protein
MRDCPGAPDKFNRGRERILSRHLDRFKEVAVFQAISIGKFYI